MTVSAYICVPLGNNIFSVYQKFPDGTSVVSMRTGLAAAHSEGCKLFALASEAHQRDTVTRPKAIAIHKESKTRKNYRGDHT